MKSGRKKGALDTHARATLRVNEILAHAGPDMIPVELDLQLHEQFKNLVSGRLVN